MGYSETSLKRKIVNGLFLIVFGPFGYIFRKINEYGEAVEEIDYDSVEEEE